MPGGSMIRDLSMRFSSRSWDIALAALGGVALLGEGVVRAKGSVWAGAYVLSVAAAAPLAWRRTAPLAVLFAVEVGAIACVIAFHASWAATGVVVVMLLTVALHGDRLRSVVVGAVTAIAVLVTTVLIEGSPDLGGLVARIGVVSLSLMLGDTVRARHLLRIATLERQAREAREREQENQRRVTGERLRIARELHDTLAHALVAINVRAGVTAHLNPGDAAAEALNDIKAGSAQALSDLRATLDLLRDRDEVAPRQPALDLASVPQLVEHARATGLATTAAVELGGATIPATVGQAAFRIVQESLTNVVRHADASHADVHVTARDGILEVEVVNDGRAVAGNYRDGHGLRGMSERATALGGDIDAGPRDGGGWRVRAWLPLRSGRS
jgi:signal transduction histidine kinase